MEERMKEDVLQEAARYGGQVLLAGETDDYQVVQFWEDVDKDSVQTPHDVFARVAADGCDVDYLRVPLTDEKAPKETDCELLIQRCWDPPTDAALVFNCQMGRGRTTTGMIIASLLHLRKREVFPNSALEETCGPDWFKLSASPTYKGDGDTRLKHGMYGTVRSLIRVLELGQEGKQVVDKVINACSAMQNLREAILVYRNRMTEENNERRRNDLLGVCLEYLERYCVLIIFTSYLANPHFLTTRFTQFMAERPELKSVLQRMLRRNGMTALDLHKIVPADEQTLDVSGQSPAVPAQDIESDPTGPIISSRMGTVLGRWTILKEDHFPGMQKQHIPQVIDGAPNFRAAAGLPVFGVAMPSVDGIRNVLKHVQAGAGSTHKVHAIWHNMREEPVVYINGRPFVLRDESRPFKNLREYGGIDAGRLEQMESRLKTDVLNEAARYIDDGQDPCGKILVARETPSDGSIGCLVDVWERVGGAEAVQTPAEVYSTLQAEGFLVRYYRVPVTDGTPPRPEDVDALVEHLRDCGPSAPLIFNCQNGAGRTTTAMVMACLMKLCRCKQPLSESVSNYHTSLTEETIESLNRIDAMQIVKSPAGRWPADMDPDFDVEDPEERHASEKGAYVAVRRLVRLLDWGLNLKEATDKIIDACGLFVNLRKAIRCNRPQPGYKEAETHQRHASFKGGMGYLERYCLLIAFSGFLDYMARGNSTTFQDWLAARGDVQLALASISLNPAASLSVIPDPTPIMTGRVAFGDGPDVDEQQVLADRRGSTLTARTILKSYHSTQLVTGQWSKMPPGVPDVREVEGVPVYAIGNPSVEGMQRLLSHFDAGPSGSTHVVLSDIREELVVYVSGRPYLRRDLERPVFSLHHVNVTSDQLQRMEEALKEDVQLEAKRWDGKILVHKEVHRHDIGHGHATVHGGHRDDITHHSDFNPGAAVVGLWRETTDSVDLDNGVCSPKDVVQRLASERGFHLTYARIPLSRERTPVAGDLDKVGRQVEIDAAGRRVVHLILARMATGSSPRFAAAFMCAYLLWRDPGPPDDRFRLQAAPDASSNQGMPALALGDNRIILNLCRLLPNGLNHKAAVDEAVDRCHNVGNLREDILSCKYTLGEDKQRAGEEVQQLGLHYLQRYIFLISFRCYLDNRNGQTFEDWVSERKELAHLIKMSHLELSAVGSSLLEALAGPFPGGASSL
eukprot:evm.model.scf_787.5 EVM.evm.TU.scf_787.5   scf_787:45503-61553(+)